MKHSLVVLVVALLLPQCGGTKGMPQPEHVDAEDRRELALLVERRFGREVSEADLRAAGPFRFLETADFFYMDRTDVYSLAFEVDGYGVSKMPLDSLRVSESALLPTVEAALERAGLRTEGRRFSNFQDEYVGAAQPRELSINFDPRTSSMHVARSVEYTRQIDELPVFGSELLIGLMADTTIGRLRIHWPRLPDDLVRDAQRLARDVDAGVWPRPSFLNAVDIEVLDVAAGVGHSGFATPRYRALPVVRVLYSRTSKDQERPLISTGYKYFDASGREVVLDVYPAAEATSPDDKSNQ